MHRLVEEPDGTTVLYIGAQNWPCPIPLVRKGNSWYFDMEAGKKDILYRRLGRNELSTIRVCQELVASAVAEGYAKNQGGAPTPYRGYYFHILTHQGKDAPGGAKSYIVNGKMTEGFVFVAYPAKYRSSGVMTFIVNEDGVVYEKDLGRKTNVLAKAMKKYNPNSSWRKA